ncbi:MAG: type VI secretion system contractile sheath large subunit [Gammaproteobacteria bacterium]
MDDVQIYHRVSALIEAIDQRVCEQVNEILHHPRFQALEASWRGLAFLVSTRSDYDDGLFVRIKMLHCTWHEMARDVLRAIEFDQSQLFQRIYSDEFDMPGGEPFGVMVCDYRVSHRWRSGDGISDVQVLQEVATVAAAALCPCLFAADATLLGLNHFAELRPTFDPEAMFQQSEYQTWQRLRSADDSRFLGIVLPDVLLREPYLADGQRADPPGFVESISRVEDMLWGNAAFAFAGTLIRAFANTGWFADIRGGRHEFGEGGVVRGLCSAHHRLSVTDAKRIAVVSDKPSVSVVIDDAIKGKVVVENKELDDLINHRNMILKPSLLMRICRRCCSTFYVRHALVTALKSLVEKR